jgi:hypothetical protein
VPRPRPTTTPGFTNPNGQVVLRRTDTPGSDHLQYVYVVQCSKCGRQYGANGSDLHIRKCPHHDGGKPGLRYGSESEQQSEKRFNHLIDVMWMAVARVSDIDTLCGASTMLHILAHQNDFVANVKGAHELIISLELEGPPNKEGVDLFFEIAPRGIYQQKIEYTYDPDFGPDELHSSGDPLEWQSGFYFIDTEWLAEAAEILKQANCTVRYQVGK